MIGFFTTSFFKKSTSIVSRNYIYIFYSCTVCNVALSKPHASLSQKQFYFRIYIIWGGEIYKIARNRAFRMASLSRSLIAFAMRIIVTCEVKQSIDRNNSETLVFRLHDYTHLPAFLEEKDFCYVKCYRI